MSKGTCTVEGCGSPKMARDLCHRHYQRWWKRGTLGLAPGYEPTRRERFDAKAVKTPSCWRWSGYHTGEGYARLGSENAHRIAYELYVGPIPAGMQIDHLCRNKGCVNPAHLEPVTQQENISRSENMAARYARRSHCTNGHEYTPENTRLGPTNNRVCRTCERDRSRRRWAENPEGMRARERMRVRPKRSRKERDE